MQRSKFSLKVQTCQFLWSPWPWADHLVPYCSNTFVVTYESRGQIFSLEGDCHEVEVAPNLELLVTFGMSLKGVCHELCT